MTGAPARVPLPLPDPPLIDDAVALRPWALADAPGLVAAWADPDIARWTGVPPEPTLAAARRWIRGDADRRAHGVSLDLVIEVEGAVAGEVGLVARPDTSDGLEMGWWVYPLHRGQGRAAGAARLLAGWAVEELCVEVLQARCAVANPASGGVARSAGFGLVSVAPDDGTELWAYGSAATWSATVGP